MLRGLGFWWTSAFQNRISVLTDTECQHILHVYGSRFLSWQREKDRMLYFIYIYLVLFYAVFYMFYKRKIPHTEEECLENCLLNFK